MKVLVTAGPTREPIDPVRFVSNRSSGKMGYAVARAARDRGHSVRLISGPVTLAAPRRVELCCVTTAAEMLAAVEASLPWCDLLIMAAAVADWRPAETAPLKLKKSDGPPRIVWEATPDILKTIAPQKRPEQVFCGFAAETDHVARGALRKLHEKNLDAVAANDVSRADRGFGADFNALTVYDAKGGMTEFPFATKKKCATRLMSFLEKIATQKKLKDS